MDIEIPVGDEQEVNVILDEIELIASGYEWICPFCQHMNHEIEVTEEVACECCKSEYTVKDCHHAVG